MTSYSADDAILNSVLNILRIWVKEQQISSSIRKTKNMLVSACLVLHMLICLLVDAFVDVLAVKENYKGYKLPGK